MKTLYEIKEAGYLSVDFYLSKSCNKSCYYCTAWTIEMRNLHVDMDFLRRTVKYLSPYKVRICLLGGEPALIKNLDEVIDEIKKYPNLVVQVMSNSLIRKFYPNVLKDPDIFYMEHLVLDFHEDRIEKLGNYDFFDANDLNNYNVIIETPNFIEYRKNFADLELKLSHANTQLKEYNSRSPTFDIKVQAPEIERRICSKFPSVPVIDFEIQKIRHCSKKVIDGSRKFDVTEENIKKMMTFDLFNFESYCKVCTDIMPNRINPIRLSIIEKLREEHNAR